MKRFLLIFATTVSIGLFSCERSSSGSSLSKVPIDPDAVDSVTVKRYHRNNHTVVHTSMRLTEPQAKKIIDTWNSAPRKTQRKFLPTFEITIYTTEKENRIRNLKINGGVIKENNDWCYDLGDSNFMETLLAEK